jgi:hypothetical protein
MIHVPPLFLAKHSPVTALAERTDRCKAAEPYGSATFSADAEANVADGFTAEALF